MGLDHGDVKKAILDQLEKYGRGFRDLNTLVNAAYALATARAHEESVNGWDFLSCTEPIEVPSTSTNSTVTNLLNINSFPAWTERPKMDRKIFRKSGKSPENFPVLILSHFPVWSGADFESFSSLASVAAAEVFEWKMTAVTGFSQSELKSCILSNCIYNRQFIVNPSR